LARKDLPDSVDTIDLSGNSLTQLPPSLFKLINLRTLNLRENQLNILNHDDFSPLTDLESIDISNNPFENSEEMIKNLQKVLPNTKIVFD
jgi:Leucine-rich repeat (LRR) protein